MVISSAVQPDVDASAGASRLEALHEDEVSKHTRVYLSADPDKRKGTTPGGRSIMSRNSPANEPSRTSTLSASPRQAAGPIGVRGLTRPATAR